MSNFRDNTVVMCPKTQHYGWVIISTMKAAQTAFGDNLKRLREERRWSQAELAQKTAISPKTISRLETYVSWPTHDTVDILAKAFNVPLTSFFVDRTNPDENLDPNFVSSISWKLSQLLLMHGQMGTTSVLHQLDNMIQNGTFTMEAYYELLNAQDEKKSAGDK